MSSAFLLLAGALLARPPDTSPVKDLAIVALTLGAPSPELTPAIVRGWVRDASRRLLHLRALSDEDVFVAETEHLSEHILDCGSDQACLVEQLRVLRAQFGLLVGINRLSDPPFLAMRLVDCERGTIAEEALGAVTNEERDLEGAVRARAKRMLIAAGHPSSGRILVSVVPLLARIEVAGGITGDAMREPDRGTNDVFSVEPGDYRVRARLDGYRTAEARAAVKAEEDARVRLELEPEESSWTESPLLLGSIAAVVVAGAVVAIAIIAGQHPHSACIGGPAASCPDR